MISQHSTAGIKCADDDVRSVYDSYILVVIRQYKSATPSVVLLSVCLFVCYILVTTLSEVEYASVHGCDRQTDIEPLHVPLLRVKL